MGWAAVKARLSAVVEARLFRRAVGMLILINAVLVGLETYPAVVERAGPWLYWVDRAILAAFTGELLLRLLAAPSRRAFFSDGWNLFDLLVVAAGYWPGGQQLSVVRVLRVLRVLRAVSALADLRRVVDALLRSLPSLAHVVLLLALLLYVYATIGVFLFGAVDPGRFGALHVALLTLFEILTLEGWVEAMHQVRAAVPAAWVYFVSFVLLGTFVSLNFFVGVIVSNLQSDESGGQQAELQALARAVARIEGLLRQERSAGGAEARPGNGVP